MPYTTTHVITQLQLLFFSALAFTVLMRTGIYPPELKSVNLDFDWTYRRAGPAVLGWLSWVVGSIYGFLLSFMENFIKKTIRNLYNSHGPEGRMARNWPTGAMVLSIAVLLGATLLVNFLI